MTNIIDLQSLMATFNIAFDLITVTVASVPDSLTIGVTLEVASFLFCSLSATATISMRQTYICVREEAEVYGAFDVAGHLRSGCVVPDVGIERAFVVASIL